MKETEKGQKRLTIFHWSVCILFFLINFLGVFNFYSAIVGYCLFCLISVIIYFIGISLVQKMVKRFDMAMPNRKATCLHLFNMIMFVLMVIVATISEYIMVK